MRVLFALLVAAVVGAIATVAGVETVCRAPGRAAAPPPSLMAPEDRRAVGDSYLSYPEWQIVYAFSDLAGVTRARSESAYDYVEGVGDFWRSLCAASRAASAAGPVTLDQKATNYIIGFSFTLEFAIKGAWERTIGALAVSARGATKTPEDDHALKTAEDYAAFLRQTPWYRFPFGDALARLWELPSPLDSPSFVRSVERRVALTLEYGGKALYARALGALAGYSPADLRIRSLARGDVTSSPDVRVIKARDDGLTLIETPRYEAFTLLLRGFARRGVDLVEIAGNRRILVTVLAPPAFDAADALFSAPLQARPGWRRVGLDADVPTLTRRVTEIEAQGGEFEHAYDY